MKLAAAAAMMPSAQLCKLGKIVVNLDAEDFATVEAWIVENRSVTWMSSVLAKAGIVIHRDTMRPHLRGHCCCPESTPLRGCIEWQG